MVGSPIISCQADTGNWLVITVEASPCLSSSISRRDSLEAVSSFASPKSSKSSSLAFSIFLTWFMYVPSAFFSLRDENSFWVLK